MVVPTHRPASGTSARPRALVVLVVLVAAIALVTVWMIADGSLDEEELVPTAALLLLSLCLVARAARWSWAAKALLVVLGALSAGGFVMFVTYFLGEKLAPEQPNVASPGAGFAHTLTAISVGIAVVPIAATLLVVFSARGGRARA